MSPAWRGGARAAAAALGVGLGAWLGETSGPSRSVGTPEAPVPARLGRDADCPTPAEVEALVRSAQRELETHRSEFLADWGKRPARVGPAPGADTEDALRGRLERIPGSAYTYVDCSEWPCIGIVGGADPGLDDAVVRRFAGLPATARIEGSSINTEPNFMVFQFAFGVDDLDPDEVRWVQMQYLRTFFRHYDDLLVAAEGGELNAP